MAETIKQGDTVSIEYAHLINLHYRRLLHLARKQFSEDDVELIRKACHFIEDACEARAGNISYQKQFIHSLSIAQTVAEEISLGAASVVGALLYTFEESGYITHEMIRQEFGEYIDNLMSGLKAISAIPLHQTSAQAENFRKLIISLARDIRVILIRLSDLIVRTRNISEYSKEDQLRLAYESMQVYAPLAHRLGLYSIKTELEDKALSILEPEAYHSIEQKLRESARKRNKFIKEFIAPIDRDLKTHGFQYEIKSRTKSIYSIWRKMTRQNVDFEEVYDIFAIRIILESVAENEKEDCWRAYSIVTDIYQPNPLRLRDWISVPKSNGYESLHTTVIGPGGNWVEVQIRTRKMDVIAEKGLAAHWKYKSGVEESDLDTWINKVRELLEAPEQESTALVDDLKLSLYTKEVFIFTPKGDLKRLPKGSTVLDFAFEVHTGVGSSCVGAKVNGKNVPIRYVLNNGDRVEIMTSKNQKPKQDWLEFVATSKAKNKIRQSLNEEIVKQSEHGKELLKRRLRNWKIAYNDETIRKLLQFYKLKTAMDLYYQIAEEKIDIVEVKEILLRSEEEPVLKAEQGPGSSVTEFKQEVTAEKGSDFLFIDEKLGNVDYKLAKCCSPIPGDAIFGFVTVNEGIKIHRVNCPNAAQMLGRYGYRIVKAQWTKIDARAFFETAIKVTGLDEMGVVSRLSDVISKDMKVNMRSISIESTDGVYEGIIKILVKDIRHLDTLIARLLKVKGVTSAIRMDVQ